MCERKGEEKRREVFFFKYYKNVRLEFFLIFSLSLSHLQFLATELLRSQGLHLPYLSIDDTLVGFCWKEFFPEKFPKQMKTHKKKIFF